MSKPTLDQDALNPAGTARRRLIKALGLGAVASQVGLDWTKPSISLGGLPAHAAASAQHCVAGVTLSIDPGPSVSYSAIVTVGNGTDGTTQVDSFATTGATLERTYTFTLAPNSTNDLGFSYSAPAGLQLSYSVSATCCTADLSFSQQFQNTSSDGLLYWTTQEAGTCSFPSNP